MPHAPLATLAAATASMIAAASEARAGLVDRGSLTDDVTMVVEQAALASATVVEVKDLVTSEESREGVWTLLHKLNNQLTGALSIALLMKDDLPAGDPARAAVETVEATARHAAMVVKEVAAALHRART